MEDKITSILAQWQSKNLTDTINKNSIRIKHASPALNIFSIYFDTITGIKRIKAMPDLKSEAWKIITMK